MSKTYASPATLFAEPPQRRYTEVTVEGFPQYGVFRLQDLNAAEASEFENERWHPNGKVNREAAKNSEARLIVRMVVNANGDLTMTADHIPQLMKLPSAFINRLSAICVEHNANVTVEQAEKNSDETPV